MNPIVSVVIPTFNRNELCERAVKSVLQQSIPCEIVVVDDGSKEPFQFAEELGTHTIKLLRTSSNRGVSAARNYGVREASTSIICFLDSDDVWLPDKLAYQLKAYEKHAGKRAIVSGWVRREPHNTDSAIVIPREPRNRDEYFMGCWYAPGSTLMVNKNIFERIGPFNECLNRLEDYEWFIRFGLSQGEIVTVKTPLVEITRGHAQNDLISQKNAEQILINWRDRLTPTEFRLMKAYLKLEIAAEAYKNERHLSSFLSLGQSLSLAPRLTLHLRNWWT